MSGPCDQGVNRHTSTRQAADEPMTEDVIKCHLRPVSPADYPASTTPAQLAQIRATFPSGVCDWSQQSVGASPRSQTWLSWGAGQPGTAPVAIPYPMVRSVVRSALVAGAQPAAAAGSLTLPNTGGPGPAVPAVALLCAGAASLAARRRRRAGTPRH